MWGCSGDKGNKVNIGIIVCDVFYVFYIWVVLLEDVVRDWFFYFFEGELECFYMLGFNVINFLLYEVFGGGGVVSFRNDL